MKNLLSCLKISSNQRFSTFFSKNVTFTKILSSVSVKFRNIHTVNLKQSGKMWFFVDFTRKICTCAPLSKQRFFVRLLTMLFVPRVQEIQVYLANKSLRDFFR